MGVGVVSLPLRELLLPVTFSLQLSPWFTTDAFGELGGATLVLDASTNIGLLSPLHFMCKLVS